MKMILLLFLKYAIHTKRESGAMISAHPPYPSEGVSARLVFRTQLSLLLDVLNQKFLLKLSEASVEDRLPHALH